MKTQTKKLFVACIALAVLAGVFTALWLVSRPAGSGGEKTVRVEVVHADGSTKSFTCQTDEEYLAGVLLAEGLAEGEEGQFGLYITKVDGEEADYDKDRSYWAVYQGDVYAAVGVSELPVTDGSTFSLVYTIEIGRAHV